MKRAILSLLRLHSKAARLLIFMVTIFVTMTAQSNFSSLETVLGTEAYTYLKESDLFTEEQWEYFELVAIKIELTNVSNSYGSYTSEWTEDFADQNLIRDTLTRMIEPAIQSSNLEELLKDEDPEVQALASQEIPEHAEELYNLSRVILNTLWNTITPDVSGNIMIEVIPTEHQSLNPLAIGTLTRFYMNLAENHGWEYEILSSKESESALPGVLIEDTQLLTHAFIMIRNRSAYRHLFLEAGTHKFRYTDSNKSGSTTRASSKVYASFADVRVYSVPRPGRFLFDESDIEFQFSRSSGAGGQNVNKRDTAVRALHKSTGLEVYVQQERTQARNRAIAVEMLRTLAYNQHLETQRSNQTEAQQSNPEFIDDTNRYVGFYNFARDPVNTRALLNGETRFKNYDRWESFLRQGVDNLKNQILDDISTLNEGVPERNRNALDFMRIYESRTSTNNSCKALLLN